MARKWVGSLKDTTNASARRPAPRMAPSMTSRMNPVARDKRVIAATEKRFLYIRASGPRESRAPATIWRFHDRVKTSPRPAAAPPWRERTRSNSRPAPKAARSLPNIAAILRANTGDYTLGGGAIPSYSLDADLLPNGLLVKLRDIVPIDEIIDKGLEIIGTAVAVVDVIGMFPNIDAEDGDRIMDDRVFAVGRFQDFDLAVLHDKPRPAGAELSDAGLNELLFRLVERTEGIGKRLFERAWNLAAAVGLEPVPKKRVVPGLGCVVEERRVLAVRLLDNHLERLVRQGTVLQQIVRRIDIGLVMLVVVIFERLARHMRLEGVIGIGKRRKRESHIYSFGTCERRCEERSGLALACAPHALQ